MVILIPYHNPCDYQVFLDNHLKALEIMRGYGYRCITLEAVEAGTTTKIPPQPEGDYMSWVSRSLIWHKERLINLGARRLLAGANPPGKIMWLDSGCYLDQEACVACEQKLDVVDLVQPFHTVTYMDVNGNPEMIHHGGVYAVRHTTTWGAPGGAWASTMKLFKSCGLYDRMIVGAGDSYFFEQLVRRQFVNFAPTTLIKRHVKMWSDRLHAAGFKADYVNGTFHHIWHMTPQQRGHKYRLQLLVRGGFDPARHIVAGPDDLYRWAGSSGPQQSRMINDVAEYMKGRHDLRFVKG